MGENKLNKNTFVNCFRIAKKNKGVLYYHYNEHYSYSTCRDLGGKPVYDFRTTNRYGKELNNEDRKSFYKVSF